MLFFFYLGFLSQTFTNHRTAGEREGHFINSSVPLPPTSQTLRHCDDVIKIENFDFDNTLIDEKSYENIWFMTFDWAKDIVY